MVPVAVLGDFGLRKSDGPQVASRRARLHLKGYLREQPLIAGPGSRAANRQQQMAVLRGKIVLRRRQVPERQGVYWHEAASAIGARCYQAQCVGVVIQLKGSS